METIVAPVPRVRSIDVLRGLVMVLMADLLLVSWRLTLDKTGTSRIRRTRS